MKRRPRGPAPRAARVFLDPLIVVSGTARILVTCAVVKVISRVKVIGGAVERIGSIAKSWMATAIA